MTTLLLILGIAWLVLFAAVVISSRADNFSIYKLSIYLMFICLAVGIVLGFVGMYWIFILTITSLFMSVLAGVLGAILALIINIAMFDLFGVN